jgi:hypothetical protein
MITLLWIMAIGVVVSGAIQLLPKRRRSAHADARTTTSLSAADGGGVK